MTQPKILAFSGSVRRQSFNQRLLQVVAEGARQAGAEVTLISLADYELPLFNEDLEAEAGAPAAALALKQLFLQHHGLLIASPEYNSSVTPLLKNTIDWISRPAPGEPRLAAYQHKVAGIVAASAGALGGLRGLVHLRAILGNIGVTVVPNQFALSAANTAFSESGQISNVKQADAARSVGTDVANMLQRLLA